MGLIGVRFFLFAYAGLCLRSSDSKCSASTTISSILAISLVKRAKEGGLVVLTIIQGAT